MSQSQQSAGNNNLYDVDTIARLLVMDKRNVQILAKRGIFPRHEHGKYNLVECVQGYIRYLRKGDLDPSKYRVRGEKADAETKELKLELMRRKLVYLDEVEQVWSRIAKNISVRILDLRHKLSPELAVMTDEAEISDRLEKEFSDVLTELAEGHADAIAEGASGDAQGGEDHLGDAPPAEEDIS
jgi:phage terminase Nu1 subunit (DNA packaging protein)